MKEKYPFQFGVLRYVHDPVTQEFLNIGVVLYSRKARYINAMISSRYKRLSDAFHSIDGPYYRKAVRHIERQMTQIDYESQQYEMFEDLPQTIEDLTAQVLPPDDSALRFGGYGGGITADLEGELERLYERLVERYIVGTERESRTDEDIWRRYRKDLVHHGVLEHLQTKIITTPTFSYQFDHAWQNERWHPVEPVSFDLLQEHYIKDKASKWIGRATMLQESPDMGTLYLLLGAPSGSNGLKRAYENAKLNLQNNIPVPHVIIEEGDPERELENLAEEIRSHTVAEE